MKFLVTRTSIWDDDEIPFKSNKWKLTKENYDGIEQYTYKTPFEYELAMEKLWYENSYDHKVTKGGISRIVKNKHTGYFIEINTLDELMDFFKDCKTSIVIQKHYCNPKITEIEIYDAYRE